jgi:osmotically-inducible protein OsmY
MNRRFFSWIVFIGLFLLTGSVFCQQGNLAEKVKNAIPNYYEDNYDVSVINGGTVQIEGNVNTLYDKYRIYDIIAKVPGVKSISNQLVIVSPPMPDKMIQDNINEEKHLVSSILEPDRIKVKVDNGIAFLDGVVSYNREKLMMQTLTSWQKGVTGIINNIKVLPAKTAKSDENITVILKELMRNQFPIEKTANFTVADGIVNLSGMVSTLWAKKKMEESFANVLGVKGVINNLTIEPVYF